MTQNQPTPEPPKMGIKTRPAIITVTPKPQE